MPYIICVNRPGCLPDGEEPVAVEGILEMREAAAAAVDTSRDALGDEPEAHGYFAAAADAALEVPEHGGTITLPDGYVVDVRFYTWLEFRGLLHPPYILVGRYPSPSEKAAMLDRYNHREV
jgi:hypothetical protein